MSTCLLAPPSVANRSHPTAPSTPRGRADAGGIAVPAQTRIVPRFLATRPDHAPRTHTLPQQWHRRPASNAVRNWRRKCSAHHNASLAPSSTKRVTHSRRRTLPSRPAAPPSQRPYDPFTRIYDILIDIAEREDAHRAALTDEERAAEDRLKAEQEQQKQKAWLATHAKYIDIHEQWVENNHFHGSVGHYDRQHLRDLNYALTPSHGGQLHFEAHDHQLYPFACYSHYDATGELPAADPPPNSIGEHFTLGLIARRRERGLGPFKPLPPTPVTSPLTHEEQVEIELAKLLADQEAEERRRAALTPAERAAEDRAWDAEFQQIMAKHEHEKRTLLKVRRAGDDTIHTLSRAELTARGFQPLFALRRATEDVYFEADDGAWYRIEAYPEYVRSGTAPHVGFLAPPWEPELTSFAEAINRFRAIVQKRKRESRDRWHDRTQSQ